MKKMMSVEPATPKKSLRPLEKSPALLAPHSPSKKKKPASKTSNLEQASPKTKESLKTKEKSPPSVSPRPPQSEPTSPKTKKKSLTPKAKSPPLVSPRPPQSSTSRCAPLALVRADGESRSWQLVPTRSIGVGESRWGDPFLAVGIFDLP